MRILGIDYGDARTGLSISDPSGFLAGSPSVIHEWNYAKLVDKLAAFIQENKIEEIVLGHPKNMDGTVGPRAEKCETLAKELEERTGLHVVLWDERRTTVAAHEILHRSGKKEKKHRQNVDAVAATLILQGYLDLSAASDFRYIYLYSILFRTCSPQVSVCIFPITSFDKKHFLTIWLFSATIRKNFNTLPCASPAACGFCF